MHQQHCPSLPAELWTHIFTYVHDIDLWILCRRVSRMLRAEAEREFASSRLRNLTIEASSFLITPEGRRKHYSSLQVSGLLGISADGRRATYRADGSRSRTRSESAGPGSKGACPFEWMHYQAISNSDLFFQRKLAYGTVHPHTQLSTYQVIRLGDYVSETPIPSIEIDLKNDQVAFDWKPLVIGIFGSYSYAQRLRGPEEVTSPAIEEFVQNYLEAGAGTLTFKKDSQLRRLFVKDLRLDEDVADLKRAYIARLRRANAAVGIAFALDDNSGKENIKDLMFRIRFYIERIHIERNTQLCKSFMRERGLQ